MAKSNIKNDDLVSETNKKVKSEDEVAPKEPEVKYVEASKTDEFHWVKAEAIEYPHIRVALNNVNFTLDKRQYPGKDYYLVVVEGGLMFAVKKSFFNYFYKIKEV